MWSRAPFGGTWRRDTGFFLMRAASWASILRAAFRRSPAFARRPESILSRSPFPFARRRIITWAVSPWIWPGGRRSRVSGLAVADGEASDPALVGLMIVIAALRRRESRGAHARTDFPSHAAHARRSMLRLGEA